MSLFLSARGFAYIDLVGNAHVSLQSLAHMQHGVTEQLVCQFLTPR